MQGSGNYMVDSYDLYTARAECDTAYDRKFGITFCLVVNIVIPTDGLTEDTFAQSPQAAEITARFGDREVEIADVWHTGGTDQLNVCVAARYSTDAYCNEYFDGEDWYPDDDEKDAAAMEAAEDAIPNWARSYEHEIQDLEYC